MRITPEELEAESTELLAALTAGWHLVTLDGHPLDVPFSIENARELYAAPALAWLREQVDEFAADRGNRPGASAYAMFVSTNTVSGCSASRPAR